MHSGQLVSFTGLIAMVVLTWLLSSHRKLFPWKMVRNGILLQFALAMAILWTPPGEILFELIGAFFNRVLSFVNDGSGFLFNINARSDDPVLPPRFILLRSFAFGVLPTIIFFSSFMAILYHLGVMQWIVSLMAAIMQRTMGTSGAESLAAAANVFVGHTEAPLVVKPYIASMTRSELKALMVGGFATISGGLLAAYAGMGIDAAHLLTASVISAPAALVVAKILQPEQERPATMGEVKLDIKRDTVNVLDAAAKGATDGLKLALNVGAVLIAFLALIAMADAALGGIGSLFGFDGQPGHPEWSLTALLGFLFSPIAWLMGIEWNDCRASGQLLGLKMFANEFVAYDQLGKWLNPDSDVQLQPRSVLIMTYALSGFANFGAIGIQIGGIGGLAPERRSDLARLGLRAMLGGAIACCMTACIAGMLIP
ncbi:MAG TPA: NupC/NupG family nucleoside CNT transporter [Planctomycetaceae bacterium]|nr:NupC/NupG family nucleoside CNT transporter [Planctomycetaceae bacterium]